MRGFGEIGERLRRSTVQIQVGRRGLGSGVIWNADGLVVTNAHVMRGQSAAVILWDGRKFEAALTARDPRRDLAALQIAAADLEPAVLGESTSLRPGDLVIAVGNPLGFQGALSTGVVHSIGGIAGMNGDRWIRADLRLAPGNSGGPLANADGRVVGINTAIVNGLGVAAPVAEALEFLRQGSRPALGVSLQPLRYGLRILEIEPGGAADQALLQRGDVLLYKMDELRASLDSGAAVLRLRFLRGNRKVREVSVQIANSKGVVAA